LDVVVSERGQDTFENFGIAEVGGPFFAAVKEGFARSSLSRGLQRQGKWVSCDKTLYSKSLLTFDGPENEGRELRS
jgi:hypothetical protein